MKILITLIVLSLVTPAQAWSPDKKGKTFKIYINVLTTLVEGMKE